MHFDVTSEMFLGPALYEMGVLLSAHIGGCLVVPHVVRVAAELAYAVHNVALAAFEGRPFEHGSTFSAWARAETVTGEAFVERFFG